MNHKKHSYKQPTQLQTFYYGAPYYPEHWDAAVRASDAERMAAASFNIVRMGEFAWDYFEPAEGSFRFDLFDETIANLGEKGIKTLMCTPTPTPPRWLTYAHPDVLRVDQNDILLQHGSRQHVCPSGETFRTYSQKITAAMAQHFADNPHVVGWQTDNEFNCHFSECHCPNCQVSFRDFLREKYTGDIAALNTAWGNAFWALTYSDFSEIQTPRHGKPAYANPAHLLDYYRFISWNTARFQHEQVVILRDANPQWFVMHNGFFSHIDYRSAFGDDLDFQGYDVYPFSDNDPDNRPYSQAFNLDHGRAWSGNFFIPEQQSGPGGQGPYFHDNPEPRELRRMAYTSIARGADGLMFFRWRTCRFGAEEYWCGILDHDNVPRRRYEEVQQLGAELKNVGPEILGTSVRVDVGIAAADVDVYDAHETLSLGLPSPKHVAERVHHFLTKKGYAVGCVHPADDLSDLKVYIIPHWALFNPAWLPNLQAWVENGGTLVIGARTATKDWNNNVVAETPPGILSKLAGIKVIEYGRQNAGDKRRLPIRFPKGRVGTEDWYEVLEIYPGAGTLARWDERHISKKPAITMKKVGQGAVIYVGTILTSPIIEALLPALEERGLSQLWPDAPAGVQVVLRENDEKRIWFFVNTTEMMKSVLSLPKGVSLLTGLPITRLYMQPHDVAVVKEII